MDEMSLLGTVFREPSPTLSLAGFLHLIPTGGVTFCFTALVLGAVGLGGGGEGGFGVGTVFPLDFGLVSGGGSSIRGTIASLDLRDVQ